MTSDGTIAKKGGLDKKHSERLFCKKHTHTQKGDGQKANESYQKKFFAKVLKKQAPLFFSTESEKKRKTNKQKT